MSYGYLGDTSTSIKQQVKNAGVLSVSDVLDLEGKGHLGGSLELIEEQTISSNVQNVDFINLEDNPFDVYYCTIENLKATTTAHIYWRFSNDNGSSFIQGATSYDYASFRILANGSTNEYTNNGSVIATDSYTSTGVSSANSYFYLYNMLDSSKYSFLTQHTTNLLASSGNYRSTFGGGILTTAETHNAFQVHAGGTWTAGTIKLYGVKQL